MGVETTSHTPQRFGRYVLLDRMGAGGMAEVFRAVVPGAEGFRRDLVVKKILTAQAQAPNFIEMFVHEARISALLHHPNVVQVFDFGQVDGSYFLAMELLRGRDLLAVLRSLRERRRSLPIPIAAHVAHQVALGLGYAHALTSPDGQPLHIVHRDVSPANIMCLQAGGVKLVDFGIAQAIGEMESGETAGSGFKGKLGYMAPERLRNQPQDGRVDLFSLGAVLWEMLTGRRLFGGKTDEDRMKNLLETPIVAPSTLRPEVPAALDQIVMKALERDPDQRYLTGQAMADDLEAVVADNKFHSRMLPALLTELFGSAPSAAHMTLSMMPPELLAVDSTTASPTPTPALSTPTPASLTPLASAPVAESTSAAGDALADTAAALAVAGAGLLVGRRRVVFATAVAAVALVVGLAAATRSKSGGARAAVPSQVSSAASSVAPEARDVPRAVEPEAVARAPLADSTTDVAVPSEPAAVVPRSTRPPRAKGTRGAHRLAARRIARGLSIDPFAEAATRGGTSK
ncbi:MAG: serine/threonine-protein kinase [Bacteroidota bacterium]